MKLILHINALVDSFSTAVVLFREYPPSQDRACLFSVMSKWWTPSTLSIPNSP